VSTTPRTTGTTGPDPRTRVNPVVWPGLGAVVVYVAIIVVLGLVLRHSADSLGGAPGELLKGVPVVVGAVALVVITTVAGWWRPVLSERGRGRPRPDRRASGWLTVALVVVVVAAAVNLGATGWGNLSVAMVATVFVTSMFVGFSEELALRGLFLTGLRTRLTEGKVWFVSTLVFALIHVVNQIHGGQVADTVVQVVFAFLTGSLLYLVRRVTGSLVWAMVLHGLWDTVADLYDKGLGGGEPQQFIQLTMMVGSVIGLCAVIGMFRRQRRSRKRRSQVGGAGLQTDEHQDADAHQPHRGQ
jgi:membrane protease YdiL (CAAX protease family)